MGLGGNSWVVGGGDAAVGWWDLKGKCIADRVSVPVATKCLCSTKGVVAGKRKGQGLATRLWLLWSCNGLPRHGSRCE
jgi:hypothetical protein